MKYCREIGGCFPWRNIWYVGVARKFDLFLLNGGAFWDFNTGFVMVKGTYLINRCFMRKKDWLADHSLPHCNFVK